MYKKINFLYIMTLEKGYTIQNQLGIYFVHLQK